MTPKPPAATIAKWLRENGHSLAALTGQDWKALQAAVSAAELWMYCDDESRPDAALSFGGAVRCMQPHVRFLAYHSIAHAGAWGHRPQVWAMAGLEPLLLVPRCKFGPQATQEVLP